MAEVGCPDVVRFAGDAALAPASIREALTEHVAQCPGCSTYVDQMDATRQLLSRYGAAGAGSPTVETPTETSGIEGSAEGLRAELVGLAHSLDPSAAEDLAQRTMEVGLALSRRDGRERGLKELASILNTLSEAQTRLEGSIPERDVLAGQRARAESLEDLDSDADEAELFYPELYSDGIDLGSWPVEPNMWRGTAQVLGPEEVNETGEVFDVLDQALRDLPEPLGELVALVDLQGYGLDSSAKALGMDAGSATASIARARNHVRGRLDAYLTGEPLSGASS